MQPYIPFDLSPIGNQSFDATEDKEFKWSFRDPSPTHLQGGYYIEYKENKSTSPLLRTGWINSSLSKHVFPANTFINGKNYAWRVMVKDNNTNKNLLTENQSTFEYSADGWLAKGLSISLGVNLPTETTANAPLSWEGTTCLKVKSTSSGANNYAYTPYDIPVSPNTAYTFSAYYNIENDLLNGYARLRIVQKNANGDVVLDSIGTNLVTKTNGWQRVVMTLTTALDTKYIELRLVNAGVGTIYWDGVQFEQGSTASTFQKGSYIYSAFSNWLSFKCIEKPTCNITFPVNDNDIIVSEIPTFTHSFEGTSQKSYQYKLYKETNLLHPRQALVSEMINNNEPYNFQQVNYGVFSIDTNTLWNGYNSLKVSLANRDVNEGVGMVIPANRFLAGEIYTISVYMKGTASVKLMLWGNLPTSLWTTPVTNITLTNTWTRYSCTVTMPNPLANQTYGIRVDTNGVKQTGDFWIAGMQIEKGNTATAFTIPEDNLPLVWDSGVITDTNNLVVIPKSIIQDEIYYSLNLSAVDENNLANNITRKFITKFSSTANALGFDVTADSDNSKMNLSWKNIDTKPANYIGSGQRYNAGKYSNGIEISQVGEKLYWDLDMPETFTLTSWYKSNLNPTKLNTSATFTRNSGAYTRDYTTVNTNIPRYDTSFFGNLLVDNQASIETNTANFGTLTSTTATKVTETAYTGTNSLLINHTASLTSLGVNTTVNLPLLTASYTFSVYAKLKSGTVTIYARIEWKDSNNTVLSSVNSSNTTLDSSWKRLIVSGTAPANAVKATLCVYTGGGSTFTPSDAWYIDGLQFEYGSTVKPYVLPSSGRSLLLEEGTTNLFDVTRNTADVENIAGTDTTAYRLDATTNVDYEDFQTGMQYVVPDSTKPYVITFQAKWNTRLIYDFKCYDSTGLTFLGNATISKTIDPAPDPNNYQLYEIKITSFPVGTARCEFFRWYYANTDDVGIANIKFPQLEQKPFSTTYVPPSTPRVADSLTIPASTLNLSQGTIEFWLYVSDKIKDTLSNNKYVLSHCTNPSLNPNYPNTIAFRRTPSNNWDFWLSDNNNNHTNVTTTDTLAIGWHHFALKWDFSQAVLFIDGVKKTTVTNPKIPTLYATNFNIGSWYGNSMMMNTMIEDFRISTIARSDSDIITNYQTKKTVDMYTSCYFDFNNVITYDYMPKQTGKILLKYLYKNVDNWLKFGYDFMTGCFYVEKMVNGTIRLIGSPATALVIGQPIFYALKQNTSGITVHTGVNGTLTKWGD